MTKKKVADSEVIKPLRRRLDIKVDAHVECEGVTYKIIQLLDYGSVLGTDINSGRTRPLRVKDLAPANQVSVIVPEFDLETISDEKWVEAQRRFSAIEPFINDSSPGRKQVEERAIEFGVSFTTLYTWLRKYREYGNTTALVSKNRGWSQGKTRLSSDALEVIDEVIETYYLKTQRPISSKAIEEVKRLCSIRDIEPPSKSAIRKRIDAIPERERLKRRGQKDKAQTKYQPAPGKFPGADYPLAYVQIDHTPVDLILVDDEYREPISRPFLTLAIDIYSRAVTGYYLSLDPPSGTSVAMCISQSILEKDEWLVLHDVDADWNVWGFPTAFHTDNGADFRAEHVAKSCSANGIRLEFRPIGKKEYGGHIERLLGTFMKDVHELPGTTFSSVAEREDYNSDKESAMTFSEFERWLVTYICKSYHIRKHSNIGMTPLRKWEIGLFGNEREMGCGYPQKAVDRHTLMLDFLPSFSRSVQKQGVNIDGLYYYADILSSWIGSRSIEHPKKSRKFIFRRDPRDITEIWFFDPELKQYFHLHCTETSLPRMSLWELRKVKEMVKAEGDASVDDKAILRGITELRDQVEQSAAKTKSARIAKQKQIQRDKKVTPDAPMMDKTVSSEKAPKSTIKQPSISNLISDDLALDELDDFGTVD